MGEKLKRLLQSGFVRDTLFPVTGEPSRVRNFTPTQRRSLPGVMGEFKRDKDEIRIRGDRPESKLLRTLVHESGHRLLDSLVRQFPQGGVSDQERALLTQKLPTAFDSTRSIQNPSAVQQHAGSDQQEHFATAFERAMQVLRLPERKRKEALEAAEEEIPGTRTMVRFLRDLPTFSDE